MCVIVCFSEKLKSLAQRHGLSNLALGKRVGVAHTTVGDWIVFGDAQTGKLDEANGRTRDAIGIVERCEARDGDAVKRARRGWLRRLVG